MFPIKTGYNFIAVNFGGYQLCQTVEEARRVALEMKPVAGIVFVREWYSERLKKTITTQTWVADR